MPQSFASLYYHLIFSTRNRLPLMPDAMRPRLYEYIGGIVRAEHGSLIAAGGTANHIHLLAALSKEQSIAGALRIIKTNSSRWVHDTFPEMKAFGWQTGYGAFTVGHSGLANVQRYIERQEEHHRKQTFEEEFIEFLERYQIPYDLQTLWR
jgi:REP element-mobilizing transposase RayT